MFADGAITPSCRHDHCQGKGLREILTAYAPHLLDSVGNGRKKKRKLKETAAKIEQFAKRDTHDAGDDDGERCRIGREQLKQIQATITEANDWCPAVVAKLITKLAYRNHFARDEGEKLDAYDRGTYRPRGESGFVSLQSSSCPTKNGQVTWRARRSNITG
jgi:hypothetical protein